MRRFVKSAILGATLLAAVASLSLTPASANNSLPALSAAHAAVGAGSTRDDANLLSVNGELLAGGIVLMAGSVYALRRSRR